MVIGIDGCRKGWVAAEISAEFRFRLMFYETLEACFRGRLQKLHYALIDIPIGLRTRGSEERLCEPLARRRLLSRKSSVFPVPVRAAVYETRGAEAASRVNFRLSGKKISRQTWNLCPKIREADQFLLKHFSLRKRVAESHPELCFAALNGGKPMTCSKKDPRGRAQRLRLLEKFWPTVKTQWTDYPQRFPGTACLDDLLDAAVLALNARKIFKEGKKLTLPENPERDEKGLPMQMVFAVLNRTGAG